MPEEQLVKLSLESNMEFFQAAEDNKLAELLEVSTNKWINDQLEIIGQNDIVAEDITMVGYIRKISMLKFLPLYTNEPVTIIEIIKEIDLYDMEANLASTNTYINLLKDKIEKNAAELKRSEELYRQAQGLAHIGNWTWTLADNKLKWSDELYKIYHVEPGTEINYELIYAFNHPDDANRVTTETQKSIATLKPFDFYYRIILKNGTIKILHARGEIITEGGQPAQIHGTLQDVTYEQLVQEELQKKNEFINKIADTTPSLIASYNVNTGKYTFINKALEKILGYDPAEVIENGVTFFSGIVHPDDLPGIIEKNTKALEEANANPPADGNEMVVEFKYRMRHKNGNYHWFHTYGTIFDRNQEKKVEHVLNVSIDITEQEEAEQALQQKNLQLQQSNSSLEEYAYVASHDLKEPMRKIATFSDRLLRAEYDNLSEESRQYLEKIMNSAKRMQHMANELLGISIISGNKSFANTNLDEILHDVIETLEFKIQEKNVKIEADTLPTVKVVPGQFRQLFLNLLNNALKFTANKENPYIKIKAEYLSPKQVSSYHILHAEKYLKISIADNGIGFDNQFSNKIFAIFQRLHSKSDYEGTGIGLAICKKIAENHGGTISAYGVVNQGATFTIIIPV
ncbi:MAG: domain S-box protein [Chitinophagaceae bacterium]|nr:domain S-box protein [Chitinophagaceae bacterium]